VRDEGDAGTVQHFLGDIAMGDVDVRGVTAHDARSLHAFKLLQLQLQYLLYSHQALRKKAEDSEIVSPIMNMFLSSLNNSHYESVTCRGWSGFRGRKLKQKRGHRSGKNLCVLLFMRKNNRKMYYRPITAFLGQLTQHYPKQLAGLRMGDWWNDVPLLFSNTITNY
jgi:hypothetical protein